MTSDETRLKRLKYRAWHRGFREADLILGPFADTYAHEMTSAELDLLEALLDEPDHDIYNWIVERTPTPAAFDTSIMSRLKKFRYDAFEARGDDRGG